MLLYYNYLLIIINLLNRYLLNYLILIEFNNLLIQQKS